RSAGDREEIRREPDEGGAEARRHEIGGEPCGGDPREARVLSFSLPYSRTRRYLTGIDWIVGALDFSARGAIGLGGFSQAIIEVDGTITQNDLRAALDQISERIPLVHGRVARDWINLAPYWKPREKCQIPLRVVELSADRATE